MNPSPEKPDLTRALEFAFEPDEAAHTLIGPYKLLEKIGEGGFGVVWMAEQQEPVRRRVALKIVKAGMDTRELIARFEAERQALALMDHPHIARVFDAGATETGRPYFVMELVRGVPITQFCDENRIPTEPRLRLFIDVCQAVQHAHQKGIIHRDLKPSNILITLHDDKPVPKVIDFGIAKALGGAPLTDKTLFTRLHTFIGTPAYTSPEQIGMSGLDIDTRSDIYSLGVLLYVLLAGRPPFDAEQLDSAGLDAARRTILEIDPPRPSQRLRTLEPHTRDTIARQRRTDAEKLSLVLRGDLDWIVMRCLEKDRTRRYETASGVAQDITRHLRHEPVSARPPSFAYKAKKFVRRNRLAVAAAAAVVLTLLFGIVGSTWQAQRAKRAEREQSAQRLLAEKARVAAENARSEAEAARITAETQRKRAEAGEQSARRHLYAADMILAQRALTEGNLGRVSKLLEKYRPPQSTLPPAAVQPFVDLREWEWRYLWGQCRSEELCTLGSHGGTVDHVAFSSDGSLLASSCQSGLVKIWDIATRREIVANRQTPLPHDVCFVPQSHIVAVASGSDIRFLDASSGKIAEVLTCESRVGSVAFSKDGRRLAICETKDLRLLDAASRRELWRAPVNDGWRVAFSPDGRLIAVVSNDPMVFLFDAATGQALASLRGFTRGFLGSLVFSPDGTLLACAGSGGAPRVLVYEVSTRRLLREVNPEGAWFGGVAFSPDNRIMAISGSTHEIIFYDCSTWEVKRRLRGHGNEAWALAFSPDGKLLASGSKDRTVRLWGPTASELAGSAEFPLPIEIDAVNLSADGTKLAVLATDHTYAVWDTSSLRQVAKGLLPSKDVLHTSAGGGNRAWAISSDGQRFITANVNGQVRAWDVKNRESLTVIQTGISDVRLLVLSSDESLVAVGGGNGTVELWKLATKKLVTSHTSTGRSVVYKMVFSPDSQFLAIGYGSRLLEVWDIGNNRTDALPAREDNFLGLAISQDNRFLATASNIGWVRLWDLRTRVLLETFTGAANGYNSVAFSPDGRRVFGGGRPTSVWVWDTESLQNVGTFRAQNDSSSVLVYLAVLPQVETVVGVGYDRRALHLWRAPSWAEIATAEKLEASRR